MAETRLTDGVTSQIKFDRDKPNPSFRFFAVPLLSLFFFEGDLLSFSLRLASPVKNPVVNAASLMTWQYRQFS
jgi:hypothetical protein